MNKKILLALSSALLLTACNQPAQPANTTSEASTSKSEASSQQASSQQASSQQASEVSSSAGTSTQESVESEEDSQAESEEIQSQEESNPLANKKVFNIIMTAATVPPVVSALNSIANGAETYAWIERGKTYSGIETSNFHNIGFDATSNASSGVTESAFTSITNTVKGLVEENPDAHFNFYTTDYKPFAPVRVAGNVGLSKDNFTVYMVEDGTATYQHARTKFFDKFSNVEGANANFETYREAAYDLFEKGLANPKVIVDKKMHNCFTEGYYYTFPLATHPNFVHLMQDKTKLDSSTSKIPGTIFRQVYALEENKTNYRSHVVYRSISQRVNALDDDKRSEYLNLMFGDYRSECDRLLHRTTRDNGSEEVPNKKFIFIGTRMRQSGLDYFKNLKLTEMPASYADASDRVREVLSTEADYNLVYNYLNDTKNYEAAWANAGDDVINAIKVGALKNYLDYAYNLKFTYRAYGNEYDILFKGHPAETFDQVEKWSYTVRVAGTDYQYRNYMHALGLKFHSDDSEGKFVGILPGGVAAENLAYLGVNTYVGGLPSSTFTGYDKSAPVLYVFGNTDYDILSDSAIEQRFLDGELTWEEDGKTIETMYMNRGNMAKWQANYYDDLAKKDASSAPLYQRIRDSYLARFDAWADDVAQFIINDHSKIGIDNTGAIIFQNDDDAFAARRVRTDRVTAIMNSVQRSDYSEETYRSIQDQSSETIRIITTEERVSLWDRAVNAFQAFVDNAPKDGGSESTPL